MALRERVPEPTGTLGRLLLADAALPVIFVKDFGFMKT